MSEALAVFHGDFGRVCLYDMDRTMVPHAHREGHLIFHVHGPAGVLVVDDRPFPLAPGQAVAVSPWQGHYYRHRATAATTLALVLYIRPGWFLQTSRRATSSLRFGRAGIDASGVMARWIHAIAATMLDPDLEDRMLEDRLCGLTETALAQSWQWTREDEGFVGRHTGHSDFRVRRALRLMQARLGDGFALESIAREVGLSRPHFFKLFRQQMGVTPTLYLNALRMEEAIARLAGTREAVADIGLDLGFSSQASFSRFFIANGVVPPSVYRRRVLTAGGGELAGGGEVDGPRGEAIARLAGRSPDARARRLPPLH
jgi:AraC-like DNA-binding protein